MAVIKLKRRRKIPKWKVEEVQRLKELLRKYPVVAVASIEGIGSYQLYEMRRKLQDKAVLRVSKNTLMRIAIKEVASEKPGIEKLADYLHGQNIFIFTEMNPFELCRILEESKVSRPARPGDVAPEDIVIPAGNTGIPPGPIMSKFNQFKIPVRIEEGSIVVVKDTVVVRKGEKIPADLADLLNRLGLEPIKVWLQLKAAYVDGLVIPGDQLRINIDEYKEMIAQAHRDALLLAVGAALPIPEAMNLLLRKAHLEALSLCAAAALPFGEGVRAIIGRALAEANTLAAALAAKCPELGISVAPAAQPAEAKPAEEKPEEKGEEKKEEESEEEIAAGLAGLFG